MEQNNYYAVFVGSQIGVFSSRQEAEEQTESYPDGYYETYNSRQEAEEALECFFIGVPVETTSIGSVQHSMNKTKRK